MFEYVLPGDFQLGMGTMEKNTWKMVPNRVGYLVDFIYASRVLSSWLKANSGVFSWALVPGVPQFSPLSIPSGEIP